MESKDKKLEFNEEQKEAIKELKLKNERKIKELVKILEEYQKKIKSLNSESKTFWEIMNSLEKSHSHYPVGHFAHYYYKDFREPVGESFLSEFGDKNPNFHQITDKEKGEIEDKLPDYEKYSKIISEAIEKTKDILTESLSENVFIKRTVGLPDKYLELQELKKNWWYPKELSGKEYGIKGSFLSYDVHLPPVTPYHREKMIFYDSLFNTATFMEAKIKDIVSLLKAINSYLPFAELIPAEKTPSTLINVEANANNESASVGNSNEFKGDTLVGKGGKIGR